MYKNPKTVKPIMISEAERTDREKIVETLLAFSCECE